MQTIFGQNILARLSRREVFRKGGVLSLAPALAGVSRVASAAPAAAGRLQLGPGIYKSIGVRPLINARGTFTVISGSTELPEVRGAVEAGALQHVALDELMDAIARRIAEITGAEWALVSSGCAAGIAHTTAACVTGGNPDLHVRIPDLAGFPKDEVIIPKASRNQYDQAVRSVGVRVIEVGDAAEYEASLGPKVAMVYIMSNPRMENGPLTYDAVYSLAKKKNIPVFTDAAAEMLTIPNEHLRRGATFVGYSGGKCLRGPQCSGLVIGRKDLLQAAWVSSAPHHGHGRSMKIGKEEMIGLLAAVEMWAQRDHRKEDETWTQWMQSIADRVTKVDGVSAAVRQPRSIDNHSPGLSISWDPAKLGITGEQLADSLWNTDPRIAVGRVPDAPGKSGISITAYMMHPDEVKIVADRLHELFSAKRPAWQPETLKTPAADLSGRWDVQIHFAAGSSAHAFHLRQQGNQVVGTHQGDFVARDFTGTVSGNEIRISSNVSEAHGAALSYRFTGKFEGDRMSGSLDMGEYLDAKWTATRHAFRA